MAKERFEQIVTKLEDVLEKLESGEMPLEDSLEQFKKGVELVKKGTGKLNEMERKIEILLKDVDEEKLASFETEEDKDF